MICQVRNNIKVSHDGADSLRSSVLQSFNPPKSFPRAAIGKLRLPQEKHSVPFYDLPSSVILGLSGYSSSYSARGPLLVLAREGLSMKIVSVPTLEFDGQPIQQGLFFREDQATFQVYSHRNPSVVIFAPLKPQCLCGRCSSSRCH